MKKKIKDLTLKEINNICKMYEKCKDCPLYGVKSSIWGDCKCIVELYRPSHWDWSINDFPWEKEIDV